MMRLAADENFNKRIIVGLLRHMPNIDIIHVREIDLLGADDPVILEWAAQEGRILLTHDIETMVGFAYARVDKNLPMPGVFAVSSTAPIGLMVEHLRIALGSALTRDEWEGQVVYFPL